jgi:WD40 repeat protein
LRNFTGHTALVNSVVFFPDGKKLGSGSFDHLIKLCDVASGKEMQRLQGHTSSVWKVSITPDGKRLASASTDGTIRLWDSASGQEILNLKDNAVLEWFDVEFSADGKYLAAASQNRMVIWDAASGHKLRAVDSPETGIDALSFSPDGRLFATGGDGPVRLWGVPKKN